jgi:hypothetical protein
VDRNGTHFPKVLDENRSKTAIVKSNELLGNHANIRKKIKWIIKLEDA